MGILKFSLIGCLLIGSLFVKAEAPGVGGEDKEYREKSIRLLALESRIVELNGQLAQMVELKKREKDPEKVRILLADLVSTTKERNKLADEHRELKAYLLYRFPNLGETIHKKYGTHQGVTLGELEKAYGLNQLLDETQELIRKKYAPILNEFHADEIEVPRWKEKEKPLQLVK